MKFLIVFFLPFSAHATETYLNCSAASRESAPYDLNLENAAVGDATGIDLKQWVRDGWTTIANRSIIKTQKIKPDRFIYYGDQFEALRETGTLGGLPADLLDLQITVDGQILRLRFKCSQVM